MFSKRKLFNLRDLFSILVIISIGLITNVLNVQANNNLPQSVIKHNYFATATPFPEINTYSKISSFTFKEMGEQNISLVYPGTASVLADLPNNWAIYADISIIDLHYDYEGNNGTQLSTTINNINPPPVKIFVNAYFAIEFIPVVGRDHHIRFPIPLSAINSTNPRKELDITFKFYSNDKNLCGYFGTLTILNDSKMELHFIPMPPTRDAWTFPDILLQGSFLPETLLLILPDQYEDNDLTVAAQLASFIGSNRSGNIKFKAITASQATRETLSHSSAIIIGQPSQNALIYEIYKKNVMPTRLENGAIRYYGNLLTKSEGIVQLIPSYINNLYSMLIVSGNNNEGVYTAAQGLQKSKKTFTPDSIVYSTSLKVPYLLHDPNNLGNYYSNVIIYKPTDIQPEVNEPSNKNDFIFTFAQQFFQTAIFYDPGLNHTELQFYIPHNWDIQPGAGLTVYYRYSPNINPKNSRIGVSLNGNPIGYLPINQVINDYVTSEITINPEDIIKGAVNNLEFNIDQLTDVGCYQFEPVREWLLIRNDSFLRIPYQESSNDPDNPITNPFNYLANGKLLIVMPQNSNSEDLSNLLTFAARLGAEVIRSNTSNITVTHKADVDINQYFDFNFLVYGRPSQNNFLAKFNEKLPQKFAPNGDSLGPQPEDIRIHMVQETDIGVIETLPLDENPSHGITILSGTTPLGIQFIIDNLASIFGRETGNLFYIGSNGRISSNQVKTGDAVNQVTSSDAVIQAVISTPTPVPQPFEEEIEPTAMIVSTITLEKDRKFVNTNYFDLPFWVAGVGILFILYGVFQLRGRKQ